MARQAPHSGRANPRSVPVPQPMLARPSKTLPAGDDWVFEVKWDGIRIVARVAAGGARLWSRGGIDVTERHAEIATALAEALGDREAVVDGELCALDPSGRPSFSLLQQGGGSRVLYAFDVLELDGESFCDRPLDERRTALDELLPPDGDEVRISRLFDDGDGLLQDQPLEVAEPAGVADDLTEDVAEQPDVAAHRLGEGSPVPIAGPFHGSVHG